MKIKAERENKVSKPCLWCHEPFIPRNLYNKYCSIECSKSFQEMLSKIWSNARESELFSRERAKLESEGKNYVLLERQLFENEENEELEENEPL
jgi:hypothetical protein